MSLLDDVWPRTIYYIELGISSLGDTSVSVISLDFNWFHLVSWKPQSIYHHNLIV